MLEDGQLRPRPAGRDDGGHRRAGDAGGASRNSTRRFPVVMVTKSEEEELMNDALGRRIDDFLIKPVKPTQVFLAIKRILDGRRIQQDQLAQTLRGGVQPAPHAASWARWTWEDWIQVYTQARQLGPRARPRSATPACGRRTTTSSSRRTPSSRATSTDVVRGLGATTRPTGRCSRRTSSSAFVAPLLKAKKKVYFVVLDCMRLDHWMSLMPSLEPFFDIENHYYYSILPTATPFSRNSLFSGLWPDRVHGSLSRSCGTTPSRDEFSKNRYERQLMDSAARADGHPAVARAQVHEDLREGRGRQRPTADVVVPRPTRSCRSSTTSSTSSRTRGPSRRSSRRSRPTSRPSARSCGRGSITPRSTTSCARWRGRRRPSF